MTNKKKHRRYLVVSWFKFTLKIFAVSILIRIFIFEFFCVAGESMANTIHSGDYLLIEKVTHGARIPKYLFEYPWLNIYSSSHYSNQQLPAKYRFPLNNGFKTGEILIFNFPGNLNQYFVKRCVGLPGQHILIREGGSNIYINGILYPNPELSKFKYMCWISAENVKTFGSKIDDMGINYLESWASRKSLSKAIALTKNEANILMSSGLIDSLKRIKKGEKKEKYLEVNIPYKGFEIVLTKRTFNLYKNLISDYEREDIKLEGNKFFLKNAPISKYIFKENYYFVIGDNRDESIDSRKWGILPESFIIGKAIIVISSTFSSISIIK